MGEAIKEIRDKLWRGQNPFADFPRGPHEVDAQGWGSTQHHYLTSGIEQFRPRIIVEVGVWKGGSVLHMAKKLRELGLDAVIIAVDTWLGIWQHWARDRWFKELDIRHGYPQLYYKFAANVVASKLEDYVVPLPLDSVNARELASNLGIVADMLHIDAGHDYASVTSDLTQWWQVLRSGGLFIGDDYDTGFDVKRATDDFLARTPHKLFQVSGNKCAAIKA